jgi:serine/threonine-protein kinase
MSDLLPPGSRVGAFIVEDLLGRGGMGAVYRARHEPSGTLVALKLIAGDADDALIARLRREARTAISIDHPNVTRVHDAGIADGTPFIAYELVTGGSLRSELKRRGRFAWPDAVLVAGEVASALVAIHAAGLVHRDLKPDNVLLDASGRCKVTDLGLVRKTAAAGGASVALTQPGEVLGTFAYMPPEQSDGGAVDFRADLYSLGILLYELLTGAVPFTGVGLSVVKKHHLDAPKRPREVVPGIPPALEAIVLALLAKSPDARPPSAAAVLASLALVDAAAPRPGRARVSPIFLLPALAAIAAFAADRGLRPSSEDAALAPGEGVAAVTSELEVGARRAFDRADPTEAIRLATAALERAPRAVATRVVRARARMRRLELPLARADLDLALRIDPGSVEAVALRAEVKDRQDDHVGARQDRARAIGLLYPQYENRRLAKDYEGALARSDAMLAIDAGNGFAHYVRGNALWLLGRRPEAVSELTHAIEIDPSPAYLSQRSLFFRELHQLERSLEDATEWVARDPKSASAHTIRGADLYDLERVVESLTDFDRAIELDPGVANPYFYRAHARSRTNDARGAVADARRCLELEPGGAFADDMNVLIERLEPTNH